MRPIKDKFVINIEVTPDERWNKLRDPDTDKAIHKSKSTELARSLIDEIKDRITGYLEDQLDESDIVYSVCDSCGVDNFDDENFTSIVKEVKITWKEDSR